MGEFLSTVVQKFGTANNLWYFLYRYKNQQVISPQNLHRSPLKSWIQNQVHWNCTLLLFLQIIQESNSTNTNGDIYFGQFGNRKPYKLVLHSLRSQFIIIEQGSPHCAGKDQFIVNKMEWKTALIVISSLISEHILQKRPRYELIT